MAKVSRSDTRKIKSLALELLDGRYMPKDVPAGAFWDWAYHPQVLYDLCCLREQLRERTDDHAAIVLRAVILGVLHGPLRKGKTSYFSNQMPRTYATKPDAAVRYWVARGMRPPYVRVSEVLLSRIEFSLARAPAAAAPGQVLCGDSARILPRLRRRFDRIVTSPPYYGMRTYVPDQWLRNWFIGGTPTVDYSAANQLSHDGVPSFVTQLADIWAKAAARCNRGARLAIRFGALPSVRSSPTEILVTSLAEASTGWVVEEILDAGQPNHGRRQARHMTGAGPYVPEIDCFAVLS